MNKTSNEFKQVPVVILCGGRGVKLNENQVQYLNKGLIQVAQQPLFLWSIRHYALHGATEFILATGFQGENFGPALEAVGGRQDASQPGCYKLSVGGSECHVRLVATPVEASTAERLLACRPWLAQEPRFALTYSDTLCDVDLGAEMRFHVSQKLVATLVGAKPPVRFRILGMRQGESLVRAFASRPVIEGASINGGYYIFSSAIWEQAYGLEPQVALENLPLERLAAAGQLSAFEHKGLWQYCDTERDLPVLQALARSLAAQSGA